MDEVWVWMVDDDEATEHLQGNIFKCKANVIATAWCYGGILVLTSEVFTVSVGSSAITLRLSTWEVL